MVKEKILFHDDDIIAVQKSAGEIVVRDRFKKEDLKNVMLHEVGAWLKSQGHQADETGKDLFPLHRLDRDTSGIVLFAKNRAAHRLFSKLFEARQMEKTYWAFVLGNPIWDNCKMLLPLMRAEGKKGRGRALVHIKNGQPAITEFVVREKFNGASWIEVFPRTGKLHQIRLHLRVLGHPVLNDSLYGMSGRGVTEPVEGLSRLALHAKQLKFVHPITEKVIEIQCPLDDALRKYLTLKKREKKEGRISPSGSKRAR